MGTNAGFNSGTQYVSLGTGLSGPDAFMRGFDIRFVANAQQVDFTLSFYNGHNSAGSSGTHYNIFESWSAAGQHAGSHNGNLWFGSGVTAAARLGLHTVPEPSAISLLGIATLGLMFRRRK